MATNIPYGSQQAVVVQSAGLFAANMQRNTTLNRLTGKMPQQADAEGTIRKQSSKTMPSCARWIWLRALAMKSPLT